MSVYVQSEIPIHQIIEAIDQFSKETGALSGINKWTAGNNKSIYCCSLRAPKRKIQ